MNNTQGGYDAAVSSKNDDLLNRWGVAHEIFTLAAKCPESWSVRIAVYGGWGTGKTSVLRFIERMASANNHTVIWFNPWGATDSVSLWRSFIDGVLSAIKENPLGPDLGKLRTRQASRKSAEILKRLSSVTVQTEKLVGAGLGFLDRWMKASQNDLQEVAAYFKGHRIIVLVDDLDRADPRLVPEVLRALKEILDIPGFSFVLGFDRDRVGAALAAQHPGWGNGLDFLDKIIDFPRWLPTPTEKDLLLLAERDLKEHASFVDMAAFKEIIQHVPTNPRSLRKFTRGLWSMGSEIGRYGADEIDWTLILLLALFRAQWSIPSEKVLREDALEQLSKVESRWTNRDSKDYEAKALSEIEASIKGAGVPDAEQKQATALLREILKKIGFVSARTLIDYAFLVEHPLPLTQKEFIDLSGKWKDEPHSSTVANWVRSHAARLSLPAHKVWDSVFSKCLKLYERCLEEAAESTSDEGLILKVRQSDHVLNMVEAIATGFSGADPVYGEDHFVKLVGIVGSWARFTNHPAYLPLREKERRLTLAIASTGKLDPVKTWGLIGPFDIRMHSWHEDAQKKKILEELENIFAPKVAEGILPHFERPHALGNLMYSDARFVEKEMLTDLTSTFWRGEWRAKFFNLIERARESAVIHENMYPFLMGLRVPSRNGDERSLLSDKEVLLSIWRGVIAQKLNPRMAGSLEDRCQEIERATGYALERPQWWKEVVPPSSNQNSMATS